jgi:hypothetical protein
MQGGIMRIRTSIIAAGAAAILGTTGALLVPAVASANSATTTVKFTAVQKAKVAFTKSAFGEQDTDINASGKTVGFDMLHATAISATMGTLNVTVDLSGGFLYGTATVNLKTGALTHAKVTGGTGSFTGATGTFTTKVISGTKTAVTITYST